MNLIKSNFSLRQFLSVLLINAFLPASQAVTYNEYGNRHEKITDNRQMELMKEVTISEENPGEVFFVLKQRSNGKFCAIDIRGITLDGLPPYLQVASENTALPFVNQWPLCNPQEEESALNEIESGREQFVQRDNKGFKVFRGIQTLLKTLSPFYLSTWLFREETYLHRNSDLYKGLEDHQTRRRQRHQVWGKWLVAATGVLSGCVLSDEISDILTDRDSGITSKLLISVHGIFIVLGMPSYGLPLVGSTIVCSIVSPSQRD